MTSLTVGRNNLIHQYQITARWKAAQQSRTWGFWWAQADYEPLMCPHNKKGQCHTELVSWTYQTTSRIGSQRSRSGARIGAYVEKQRNGTVE